MSNPDLTKQMALAKGKQLINDISWQKCDFAIFLL